MHDYFFGMRKKGRGGTDAICYCLWCSTGQDKEKEEAQSERREQALKQKQVRGSFKEEEVSRFVHAQSRGNE